MLTKRLFDPHILSVTLVVALTEQKIRVQISSLGIWCLTMFLRHMFFIWFMMFLERSEIIAQGRVKHSFRHLVSTGGGHLYHLPQAVTAPGSWSSALTCFSVVTGFPGKCQILQFFPFPYCLGRLGKCAIKMFWLSYFLNDNSYRRIIIFLLLAKECFFLFFFFSLLPAFDVFVFVSLENQQAFKLFHFL